MCPTACAAARNQPSLKQHTNDGETEVSQLAPLPTCCSAPVRRADDLVAGHGGIGDLAHHIAVGEADHQPAGAEKSGMAAATVKDS